MWGKQFFGIAALATLAGCEGVTDQVVDRLAGIGAPTDATSEGIRTLSVLSGAARVRGPEGYCIDQGASDAAGGFAVMAGCALLSEDVVVMPSLDGLVTVQFGAEGTASVSGAEAAFAEFLRSETGRGILAGNGQPGSVTEVRTVTEPGVVVAQFEDTSGPAFATTTGDHWRGFVDIGGRLTTVSVLSFDRAPLTSAQGERLLLVAIGELVEANAPAATPESEG